MTQIDNEKFGKLIHEMRKEKGLTQKELAEKLYISDKAVSKWERGLSMPDISLLIPLSQILGLTTTELLSGKRLEKNRGLTIDEVEDLMNKTIQLSKEEVIEQDKRRIKRRALFFVCLILGLLGLALLFILEYTVADFANTLLTTELLMLFFGTYLTFFAKQTLPTYYDENKISFYHDGFLRINMVGLHFNNSNWSHILHTMQLSIMVTFALLPFAYLGVSSFFSTPLAIRLALFNITPLVVLFLPAYIVGKKFQ